ncbi:serine/threonine-protein kinase nekl-2-like [Contarinia nasturtii]|uniref:serine/threonine-protein kinase nekl-2-like n=1 Tax=Contarinia nasturtii TaxID=265458 RepID=UPI0012D43A9E|nr:serine/threonine-protein kinase nekl-2-like [Contarinia nasturtii]
MDECGFTVVENIGTGTFGTVYKCMDQNNDMRCIKQIKLNNASDDAASKHLGMIQREIYLLQNLAHPRIISMYGYFCSETDDEYVYIVMEYAAFGSLSKIIAENCAQHLFFDEQKIKQFLIDMVLGIEYLHMKNVVHKDLKPCNILIFDNEHLKIADFGISKITDNSCDNIFICNKIKEAGGSPIYMAPETLIHNQYTFSSDIWALGCILYELCTLQPAFGFVESMDQLIRCTLTKAYTPINPHIHPCNKDMVDLVEKMMIVDVQERATVKDVISSPAIIVDYYHSYFQFDS